MKARDGKRLVRCKGLEKVSFAAAVCRRTVPTREDGSLFASSGAWKILLALVSLSLLLSLLIRFLFFPFPLDSSFVSVGSL